MWLTANGHEVAKVVCEVGAGLNGKRTKLRWILSDLSAIVVAVEHRDRLAGFGVEHFEAAFSASGRRVVVTAPGEVTDGLVPDMIDVLTPKCTRVYGRSGAGNRTMRAITATKHEPAQVI